MRTIKQAIENSGIPSRLVNAVIRQLGGKESLKDVYNHGASGGFCGFSYYADTCAFFKRNKVEILGLVDSMARDTGEQPAAIVAGFNCLKIKPEDSEGMREVYRCLDGRVNRDDTQVSNALAWFALEEVARAMCDE
jgi:hypothetical protein